MTLSYPTDARPFYVVNCATLWEFRTVQYYSLYARRLKLCSTSFELNQIGVHFSGSFESKVRTFYRYFYWYLMQNV